MVQAICTYTQPLKYLLAPILQDMYKVPSSSWLAMVVQPIRDTRNKLMI